VEIAGADDLDAGSAMLVENRASLPRESAEITAVDAYRLNGRVDRSSHTGSAQRVVSVNQEGGVSGKDPGESRECFGLGGKGLNPRMSHGSHGRNSESQRGFDVTGCREAGDHGRSCRHQTGEWSVSTPGAEFVKRFSAGGGDDSGGLG